jgi:hypothetical protein
LLDHLDALEPQGNHDELGQNEQQNMALMAASKSLTFLYGASVPPPAPQGTMMVMGRVR